MLYQFDNILTFSLSLSLKSYVFVVVCTVDSVAAEVALHNGALPQCDALLKAAIALVGETPTQLDAENKPTSAEADVVRAVSSLLSLLVVVPCDPETGPLYLFRGLVRNSSRANRVAFVIM